MKTAAVSQSIRNRTIGGMSEKRTIFQNKTVRCKVDRTNWAAAMQGCTRMAALLGLCGALAACGVSQLTAPFQDGIFGGGSGEEKTAEAAPATPASIIGSDQTAQSDTTGALTTGSTGGCPRLGVTPNDKIITFHAPGAPADDLSVMHRGEITKTARECGQSANGLRVKYGFSGRLLLGPKGKAGSITLPAQVTVVDGKKATLKTEKVRVVVNIPAGGTTGYFSEVREIDVPVPLGVSPKTYQIYVGFDRSASGAS